MSETILDPDLPIIDPHHHLWDMHVLLKMMTANTHPFTDGIRMSPVYLLEELLADMGGAMTSAPPC